MWREGMWSEYVLGWKGGVSGVGGEMEVDDYLRFGDFGERGEEGDTLLYVAVIFGCMLYLAR